MPLFWIRTITLIAAVLWFPVDGLACSCIGPTPVCSAFFGTPVIVRGTVVERTLIRPPQQTITNLDGSTSQIVSPGRYKVRLAVSETFRGASKSELFVFTEEQSSACGFPFQVGLEYVVFTYNNQAGTELWTSKCSKTHVLAARKEDEDLKWMRGMSQAPPGGRVFGSVMIARVGPLKGAKVSLRGTVDTDMIPDEKGAYEVNGLPAGDYQVSAIVPAGFHVLPARTITVSDKGCTQVDWHVAYDGHVRGRVVDQDGIPVGHMVVNLEQRDTNAASGFSMRDLKETAPDGRYDFPMVGPGEYFVIVNRLGASPTRPYPTVYYPSEDKVQDAEPIQVAPSSAVDLNNVVMPRAWKKIAVKAKVVDADGAPVAGVMVDGREVKNLHSVEPMTATTDSQGMATLPVYEGQEYYITAMMSGGVQQRCGGPVRVEAKQGADAGTIRIEHPWGNCLAQLNPDFRAPR